MQVSISLITILVLGKEYLSAFRFPEYTTLKQFTLKQFQPVELNRLKIAKLNESNNRKPKEDHIDEYL